MQIYTLFLHCPNEWYISNLSFVNMCVRVVGTWVLVTLCHNQKHSPYGNYHNQRHSMGNSDLRGAHDCFVFFEWFHFIGRCTESSPQSFGRRSRNGKAQCAKCKPGLAAGTQSVYCTYAPGCTVVAVLTFFCEFVLIIFLLIVFFVLLHFIYCLVF